jgi:hypothetical protein
MVTPRRVGDATSDVAVARTIVMCAGRRLAFVRAATLRTCRHHAAVAAHRERSLLPLALGVVSLDTGRPQRRLATGRRHAISGGVVAYAAKVRGSGVPPGGTEREHRGSRLLGASSVSMCSGRQRRRRTAVQPRPDAEEPESLPAPRLVGQAMQLPATQPC